MTFFLYEYLGDDLDTLENLLNIYKSVFMGQQWSHEFFFYFFGNSLILNKSNWIAFELFWGGLYSSIAS